MSPHYHWRGKDLVLRCQVQPRASRDGFCGLHGDRLKIRLVAPPVDGKANEQLQKFLADAFGVPRSRVTLLQGDTGRAKTVLIESPGAMPDLAQIFPESGRP